MKATFDPLRIGAAHPAVTPPVAEPAANLTDRGRVAEDRWERHTTAPLDWSSSGDLWPGRSDIQEVCAQVCITNVFGAQRRPLLDAHRITHILVCAHELPERYPHSFTYLTLKGLTDNTGTPLRRHLDIALDWIDSACSQGGRVLLHCASGSSRSGAILVAYLMRHEQLTTQEALRRARCVRPIIKPNPGFLEQLDRLHENCYFAARPAVARLLGLPTQ